MAENFIPPLLDAVLLDYQRNVPAAREPEVLSTMATIVNRLEVNLHTFTFGCLNICSNPHCMEYVQLEILQKSEIVPHNQLLMAFYHKIIFLFV